MSEVKIHVDGLEQSGRRFIDAWKGAEAGDFTPQRHLSFDSLETLMKVLTPKRFALLRRLHAHPAASVAALARDLGRDYKRVHEDVEALTAAGLIERDGGLTAPYDAIEARMAM